MAQSPSLTPDEGLLGRLRSDRANALLMLSRIAGGKSAPRSADYYHGVVERSERALRQAGRPAFLFNGPEAQTVPAQGRVVDVPAHPLDHASRGIERQIAQRGGLQGPPDPQGTPLATPHAFILNPPGVKTPAPNAKGGVVDVPSPAQIQAERDGRLGLERGRHAASDAMRARTIQKGQALKAQLKAELARIEANRGSLGTAIPYSHYTNVQRRLREVEGVIHQARGLPPVSSFSGALTPQERASATSSAPEPSWWDELLGGTGDGPHDMTRATFGAALAAGAGGASTYSPTQFGIDPTTDRYAASAKNVLPDLRAVTQGALSAPHAATRAAASATSRALGNGGVDPSVYQSDVPSRVADHIGEYAPYAIPGVGATLGGIQAADVAVGVAKDGVRKTASDLYRGMAPWEAKTPEEAVLRFLGLLGGAAHVAGMSPAIRGRVGIAVESMRRGRPVDPAVVTSILRDAHGEAAALGQGRASRPAGPKAATGALAQGAARANAGQGTSSSKGPKPTTAFKLTNVAADDPTDPVSFARKYADRSNHPITPKGSFAKREATIKASVSQKEIDLAARNGIRLDPNATRTIDNFAVLHTDTKHGPRSSVKNRGEAEVKPEDYAFLHDVLSSPDQVVYHKPKSPQAPARFGLLKRINGHILYVEEARGVSDPRLALVSIRKWPAASDPPEGFLGDYSDTSETIRKSTPNNTSHP